MSKDEFYRHAAFILRCSAAAALAFLLARAVGLPHPVWATMSGIIVSQEKLNDTNRATLWRLTGTIVGVIAAVIVGGALLAFGASVPCQLAGAVALCALLVRLWPDLRVSMWTAPIVLLTRSETGSILQTGLWRGEEVLLGGLVGILCHFAAERVITWLDAHEPHDVVT
ncbi:FUSC family protein [Acidocella sp.]|uniref:FUSC family protein n=1 Tax=Acidocella sp. TaxID=50710 RepID=UPI003D048C9D